MASFDPSDLSDMSDMSEEKIIRLSCEFQGLRSYSDKLRFFDRHFSIIPFSFPGFQSDLLVFFGMENTALFEVIFRSERLYIGRLEKQLTAGGHVYVMNVKPSNSNAPVFNDFILTKYLSGTALVDELVRQQCGSSGQHERAQELLVNADQMLRYVEYKSRLENDRSLATQFMKVFYRGYCDYNSGVRQPLIRKKRKFIELYLYVQGQLYGRYTGLLRKVQQLSRPPRATQKKSEGVSLLKDLGIVDILREKVQSRGEKDPDQKTIELICRITGQDIGTVSRYLLTGS